MRDPDPISAADAVRLVVRADANPTIGAGHAMRCLNLIDSWLGRRLGPVSFEGEIQLDFVEERMRRLGIAPSTAAVPLRHAVLVVDDYAAPVREALARRPGALLRVLVDDLGGAVPCGFDVVWNPNAYDAGALYPGFDGRVISGPESVPIRESLPRWQGARSSSAIGITVGGGRVDPAIREGLELFSARLPTRPVMATGEWVPEGWKKVSRSHPWSEFVTCSSLITASGTSVWEAAAVGIPAVVMRTAPNQSLIAAWVGSTGTPVIEVSPGSSPEELAEALTDALPRAKPLPRLENGAPAVARALLGSARSRLRLEGVR